jgi:isoleucyl-tRNA synthetase
MSKSAGTGLSPQDITETHGAEILRLWVAAEDYRDDMRISKEILGRLIESFRRIRNTARFLIANLYDFQPARDVVSADRRVELDRWILARTEDLVERCDRAYRDYEFHLVYHALNNFCTVDLSALYLDIAKDRLYTAPAGSRERRSAQTALWRILDVLVRLMAPILTFTAEEVWAFVPAVDQRADSVLLADFPSVDHSAQDATLLATWDKLLAVRDAVTKALEEARQKNLIGHSLDARIELGFEGGSELAALLEPRFDDLPTLFIVSQVERSSALGAEAQSALLPDLRVAVSRAAGAKCARCWNYRTSVGSDATHPAICAPCVGALAVGGATGSAS